MGRVLTLGEFLLRFTPLYNHRIRQADTFTSHFGGAEANVAINLSQYGHQTSFLSALPSNDIGQAAVSTLREAGVDTSFVKKQEGRMGIYFYEEGFSLKSPQVIYDRENSSFLRLAEATVDWDAIFKDTDIFHLTGITLALHEDMKNFTFQALKEAKRRRVQISFDFNYRSQLWSISEAKEVFLKVLPYVDIGFFGYKDLSAFFPGGETLPASFKQEVLEGELRKASEDYGIDYIACTNREVLSQSENTLTGYLYDDGSLVKSSTYSFEVLERIGGGDAFASGILHGILQGLKREEIVEFGTASSVLKHFVYGDYTQFSAEEVERFITEKGEGSFR